MAWSVTVTIEGLPTVELPGLPAVGPVIADFVVRSAQGRLVPNQS